MPTPKTRLMRTAITETMTVRRSALITSGSASAVLSPVRPSAKVNCTTYQVGQMTSMNR